MLIPHYIDNISMIMAVKEEPKDYSSLYREDCGIGQITNRPIQIPIWSRTSSYNTRPQPPIPTTRSATLANSNRPTNNGPSNNNATNTTINSSVLSNNHQDLIHTQQYQHQHNNTVKRQPQPQTQPPQHLTNSIGPKTFDGRIPTQKRESTLDTALLFAKLKQLEDADRKSNYAMHTLNEHYKTVFNYRVCIKYHDDKYAYIVRVTQNTLKAVRDKLPIRGMYRYFFRGEDNEHIEIEDENAIVPYEDGKDGQKHIYCHVFPL